MKITIQAKVDDPNYPIMDGKTPSAKEFNLRQEKLWKTGATQKYDFQQVVTVILEMLLDDYDQKHKEKKG